LQGIRTFAGFSFDQKTQVLARNLDGLFGYAGVLVSQIDDFGEVANIGIFLCNRNVQAVGAILGNGQINVEARLFGIKEKAQRLRVGGRVRLRNLKGKSVRKEPGSPGTPGNPRAGNSDLPSETAGNSRQSGRAFVSAAA